MLPAFFSILWFSVFGGTSLFYEQQTDGALNQLYQQNGFSSVIYQLFEYLSGTLILTLLFLAVSIVCFITAADSNTDVIGALCAHKVDKEG